MCGESTGQRLVTNFGTKDSIRITSGKLLALLHYTLCSICGGHYCHQEGLPKNKAMWCLAAVRCWWPCPARSCSALPNPNPSKQLKHTHLNGCALPAKLLRIACTQLHTYMYVYLQVYIRMHPKGASYSAICPIMRLRLPSFFSKSTETTPNR